MCPALWSRAEEFFFFSSTQARFPPFGKLLFFFSATLLFFALCFSLFFFLVFLSSSPAPLFFCFCFSVFSFVFEKEEEKKKNASRELVSYSSFARDDHTCSKARNEKFVASFGVVFFFRSAPVASRLFLFSFPSSLCLLLLCLLVPLLQPSTAASINNDD